MRILSRYLLLLLILAWSDAVLATATTYSFGFQGITGNSGIDGTVTVSVQIPGTFGGITPADPGAGRYLKNAMIWCDSPATGDQFTLLQVVDTDGVVPVPIRGNFPNYPVIIDLLDNATGGTKALFIPSGGISMDAFDTNGNTTARFLPSQLYLKMTYQAGGLGIGKTFRAVVRWGIWQ